MVLIFFFDNFGKMKRNVRFYLLNVNFVSLIFLPLLTTSKLTESETKTICESKECKASAKMLKKSVNLKVNPCDDFYEYACGNWPNHHTLINYPTPMSSLELRYIQNEQDILEYLKKNNDQDEPEAVQKARKLFSMCLDRESYKGDKQLNEILSKIGLPAIPIDPVPNPNFDYVSALARTTRLTGVKMFFDVGVDFNPYNHSVNVIWLLKPTAEYDLNIIPFVGDSSFGRRVGDFILQTQADNLTRMTEILLVKAGNLISAIELLMFTSQQYDLLSVPTIYTLEELQIMSDNIVTKTELSIPKLNWTRYLEETFDGLENVTLDLRNPSNVQIAIVGINYVKMMIEFIHTRKLEDIEFGLWWKVALNLLPYTNFTIFQKLSDDSNEELCKNVVMKSFRMAMSYMYLKKDEHNVVKIKIEEMLKYIKDSYKTILEEATWMDEKTTEKCLLKLASMKSFIAYPISSELDFLNEMYGNVEITHSVLDTLVTKIQSQIRNNLNQMNDQINDFSSPSWTWTLGPTFVNAFYEILGNFISIPAGLLGPPLFINSLNSLIYGSIGSVIGHELTHAFDCNGRKFNNEGMLESWWNNETLAKYEEKSQCFLKAYGNYSTSFQNIDLKANSTLTLAEDVSDNVGFKAALFAYRKYVSENGNESYLYNFENFTSEQLFTLGFANFWCESPTYVTQQRVQYDDHSPSPVRVNGVVKNSQEFSQIWNCSIGSNMNPLDEKCSLW